jgi:hypothetical protein
MLEYNMEVFLEALFVGIYCVLLFIPLSNLLYKSRWKLLFVLGFCKHILGYFFQLHKYYCNNGYACSLYFSNLLKPFSLFIPQHFPTLFVESIIEGSVFIFLGYFIRKINMSTIFLIGFSMHLLAELFGIHLYFCKNKCNIV